MKPRGTCCMFASLFKYKCNYFCVCFSVTIRSLRDSINRKYDLDFAKKKTRTFWHPSGTHDHTPVYARGPERLSILHTIWQTRVFTTNKVNILCICSSSNVIASLCVLQSPFALYETPPSESTTLASRTTLAPSGIRRPPSSLCTPTRKAFDSRCNFETSSGCDRCVRATCSLCAIRCTPSIGSL